MSAKQPPDCAARDCISEKLAFAQYRVFWSKGTQGACCLDRRREPSQRAADELDDRVLLRQAPVWRITAPGPRLANHSARRYRFKLAWTPVQQPILGPWA